MQLVFILKVAVLGGGDAHYDDFAAGGTGANGNVDAAGRVCLVAGNGTRPCRNFPGQQLVKQSDYLFP
ncbi:MULTISPECIES: hypothetical protein [unclassified Bradyrhizobium]|uniref:hypothetical protein n=1 Tax=unclassified Bradyrhizobium TaxID=2631580 RepID=UPI0024790226|nr:MULTISPECIES: hypothetical protein [unclassified Bradyrhizobium]WGR73507.1 hypothetical protein MTX24_12105 [Bradyrhizobium sp. ISRA426]WGR78344.1 hypothetical protein MTX21_37075 [Bradyrhizobium sp. ISRA430]WGR88745.1 hypothetical protein MTX25_12115 [Bradyrhizobium sp. ISRA432]